MANNFSQNFVLIKHWQVQKHKELKKMLEVEAAGGICMMMFAALAIIIYNSPLSDWYSFFIEQHVIIGFSKYVVSMDLKTFTGDVLLVLFFATVSMELKRDFEQEILHQKKQILLPALAAVGGMMVPSLIYAFFNWNNPESSHGWGIPVGTDTAFAIAVLLLLGKGLPRTAKVFMLATAIFDDLGAIIIIALFYSSDINLIPLAGIFVGCLFLFVMNRANIVTKAPYIITSIVLFFLLHQAGIHTTIAGVMLGMAIPLADNDDINRFPLKELLDDIHPFVSFFVLPLFAFVSAGVPILGITIDDLIHPVTLGVAAGLFFGKQIGIFGVSYLLIRLKVVSMPKNLNLRYMYGVSIIAGIGFTMSIFIGHLTFPGNEHLRDNSVLGILISSALASIWGYVYLRYAINKTWREKKLEEEQKKNEEQMKDQEEGQLNAV